MAADEKINITIDTSDDDIAVVVSAGGEVWLRFYGHPDSDSIENAVRAFEIDDDPAQLIELARMLTDIATLADDEHVNEYTCLGHERAEVTETAEGNE